ncbi:unnamed protein product [Boreogadus saida]
MVDDEDAADASVSPRMELQQRSISIRNSVCPAVAFTIKQKCELSSGHHEFIHPMTVHKGVSNCCKSPEFRHSAVVHTDVDSSPV